MNQWIETIGRFLTPVGILILLLLQSQFVSKADFKDLKAETGKLETAVTLLVEQQKQMKRYDIRLYDFDNRLRKTEIELAKKGE